MELIDFHIHLLKRETLNPTLAEFLKTINPDFYARMDEFARKPSLTINYLKSQDVKYAVVLAENCPATSGLVTTEAVIEYCQEQDMLIPFANLNPNVDPHPARKLEYYVKDCQVKGLKLLPSYQFFYPNESRVYPIYAKAQELNIPIIFHTGSSTFEGTRMKYCDPIYLDDVAVDFPDLRIIMAHSGRGFWYEECFFLSRLHKNVYMDITGLPPKKLLSYFPELDKNGDKVIFGSDWPAMPTGIKENAEAIQSLPLSSSTIEGILYCNAARVLFG
jgi:hypothetical protein